MADVACGAGVTAGGERGQASFQVHHDICWSEKMPVPTSGLLGDRTRHRPSLTFAGVETIKSESLVLYL